MKHSLYLWKMLTVKKCWRIGAALVVRLGTLFLGNGGKTITGKYYFILKLGHGFKAKWMD